MRSPTRWRPPRPGTGGWPAGCAGGRWRCWNSWPPTGPSPFAGGAHRRAGRVGATSTPSGAWPNAWLGWAERLMSLRAALEQAGRGGERNAAEADVWSGRRCEKLSERFVPELSAAVAPPPARTRRSVRQRQPAAAPGRPGARSWTWCGRSARRLEALGGDGRAFFASVVGGSLPALVQGSFANLPRGSRSALVPAAGAGHRPAVAAPAGCSCCPSASWRPGQRAALLSAEDGAARPDTSKAATGLLAYRELRAKMPGSTLAFALVELFAPLVASRGRGRRSRPGAAPGGGAGARRSRTGSGRASSPTTWPTWSCRWRSWSAGGKRCRPGCRPRRAAALDRAATSSEFFKLTHEEAALARFTLEARLVAMVFEGAAITPLTARLQRLDQATAPDWSTRLARQRLQ